MIAKAIERAIKGIYGLFCAIFEADSEVEKQKDKEIEYETKTWGEL